QHMPKGFTGPFARRLNSLCKLSVQEAEQGDEVKAGTAYIAPAGCHMRARRTGHKFTLDLSTEPSDVLHIPSVDEMMHSVAEAYGPLAVGVIMTGMGADGLQGMQAIHRAGGFTIGQDEASSTVYGMPAACAQAGILDRVTSLMQIPEQLILATSH